MFDIKLYNLVAFFFRFWDVICIKKSFLLIRNGTQLKDCENENDQYCFQRNIIQKNAVTASLVSYKITTPYKNSKTNKDKYKYIIIYYILLVSKQN